MRANIIIFCGENSWREGVCDRGQAKKFVTGTYVLSTQLLCGQEIGANAFAYPFGYDRYSKRMTDWGRYAKNLPARIA